MLMLLVNISMTIKLRHQMSSVLLVKADVDFNQTGLLYTTGYTNEREIKTEK